MCKQWLMKVASQRGRGGFLKRGMKADKLRETLEKNPDFKNSKTLLDEEIEKRGHLCLFFPNFHCELNAIERC